MNGSRADFYPGCLFSDTDIFYPEGRFRMLLKTAMAIQIMFVMAIGIFSCVIVRHLWDSCAGSYPGGVHRPKNALGAFVVMEVLFDGTNYKVVLLQTSPSSFLGRSTDTSNLHAPRFNRRTCRMQNLLSQRYCWSRWCQWFLLQVAV